MSSTQGDRATMSTQINSALDPNDKESHSSGEATASEATEHPSDLPGSNGGVTLDRSATRVSMAEHTIFIQAQPKGGIGNTTSEPFPPVERSKTAGSSRPYSAFTRKTKWLIAILGGIGAIFSPISSNIFVPAIPLLARDFNRTQEEISLAVTIYLVFQAITPSFFGAASDSFGRRPVFLTTMTVYIGANIGLALMPTSAYWLLLVLRALQSTGGSAVISIGAGAISDVAEPRERGMFMAIFQCGAMIGPALGPLLGGIFADTLGWRAIFWFLTIASGVVMVPFIFFFPETLRSIVGDGSIPPPTLNASPSMIIQRRKMNRELQEMGLDKEPVQRPDPKPYQPLSAFMILFNPEVVLIFIFVSFIYLEFYCLLTLFSTALDDTYHLNELMIGLCYLPSGAGTILSTIINGKQIDYYYQREEKRVGGDYRKKPHEFRIDLTRIRCIYPFMALFCTSSIAIGWCLQVKAPLAATLVMQFLMGLGSGTIATATVYGQDILPGKGGAVSASLNLVRCAFGAVGTAVIQLLYNAIGAGWTFVLLSGLCVASLPLTWIVIRRAPRWREWRAKKAAEGSAFFKEEQVALKQERAEVDAEEGANEQNSEQNILATDGRGAVKV